MIVSKSHSPSEYERRQKEREKEKQAKTVKFTNSKNAPVFEEHTDDEEDPIVTKHVHIPVTSDKGEPHRKRQKVSDKDEEEEEEAEEDEEEEEIVESGSSTARLVSNRIVYDEINEDYEKMIDTTIAKNSNFDFLDALRPLNVATFPDTPEGDKQKKELYKNVTAYLKERNNLKNKIAEEPLRDFITLVAAESNTLVSRLMPGGENGRRGGDSGSAPADGPLMITSSITAPATPPRREGRTTGKHPMLYEESSGPIRNVRDKRDELSYEVQLLKMFNDPTIDQTERLALFNRLREAEKSELKNSMVRQYQAWIDRDEITGLGSLSPTVYGAAKKAYQRIRDTTPHLSSATMMDFIEGRETNDPTNNNGMRTLFAVVTACFITRSRNKNPTRVPLQMAFAFNEKEANMTITQIRLWTFDEGTRTFSRPSTYETYPHVRGAPAPMMAVQQYSGYVIPKDYKSPFGGFVA